MMPCGCPRKRRRRRRPKSGKRGGFNRCCCKLKKSFDEIYQMFNP